MQLRHYARAALHTACDLPPDAGRRDARQICRLPLAEPQFQRTNCIKCKKCNHHADWQLRLPSAHSRPWENEGQQEQGKYRVSYLGWSLRIHSSALLLLSPVAPINGTT